MVKFWSKQSNNRGDWLELRKFICEQCQFIFDDSIYNSLSLNVSSDLNIIGSEVEWISVERSF